MRRLIKRTSITVSLSSQTPHSSSAVIVFCHSSRFNRRNAWSRFEDRAGRVSVVEEVVGTLSFLGSEKSDSFVCSVRLILPSASRALINSFQQSPEKKRISLLKFSRTQEMLLLQDSVALLMFILILTLCLFILIFVASGIKILKEYERAAVFRLGKFVRISGPGIIWVTPIIDKVVAKLSLGEQQTIVDTGKFISEDGSACRLTGFVNWKIIDAERAALAVENYRSSTDTAINHQIRETCESLPSDAIISSEEQVYSNVKQDLEPTLDKWGIKITELSLKTAPNGE